MLRISLPVPETVIDDRVRARFIRFFTAARDRLRQLPEVTAVGAASSLPLDGLGGDRLLEIEGYVPAVAGDRPDAQSRHVTPGWLEAMGIPLRRGRTVSDRDDGRAPPVVVVNEAFVRNFLGGGDPLGRRIRLGALAERTFPWATIVGVVGDVREYGLDEAAPPAMYWPLAQSGESSSMALVVRTRGEPRALAGMARAAIAELDATQPIFDLQPLSALVSASLAQRRFTLTLLALFGLVALLLAGVGVYAVVSYGVAQRTHEIGIRVALGASPRAVLTMVVRDAMGLVAIGVVVGTLVALALTRVAASLLYGVSPTDGATYAAIATVLIGVALLAALLPARRAMRIDPTVAMRSD